MGSNNRAPQGYVLFREGQGPALPCDNAIFAGWDTSSLLLARFCCLPRCHILRLEYSDM